MPDGTATNRTVQRNRTCVVILCAGLLSLFFVSSCGKKREPEEKTPEKAAMLNPAAWVADSLFLSTTTTRASWAPKV